MPLFNEILNPRLTSALVRVFGMKTGGNPAPTLAPEVQPTFEINQQEDPAAYFVRRSRIYSSIFLNAATPGFRLQWQLRNPTNSGVLLVVRNVVAGASPATYMGTFLRTTDLATIITARTVHDTRWLLVGGGATAAGIVSAENVTVPLGVGGMGVINNDVTPIGYVLAPGTALLGEVQSFNTQSIIGVMWEERPVAAEELATG